MKIIPPITLIALASPAFSALGFAQTLGTESGLTVALNVSTLYPEAAAP